MQNKVSITAEASLITSVSLSILLISPLGSTTAPLKCFFLLSSLWGLSSSSPRPPSYLLFPSFFLLSWNRSLTFSSVLSLCFIRPSPASVREFLSGVSSLCIIHVIPTWLYPPLSSSLLLSPALSCSVLLFTVKLLQHSFHSPPVDRAWCVFVYAFLIRRFWSSLSVSRCSGTVSPQCPSQTHHKLTLLWPN